MIEQIQEQETAEVDGRVYDAETGEFLRLAGRSGEWVPVVSADFEWLGEVMSETDAQIAAIEQRRKFYNENFDAMVRDVKRKKDGLLWKFGKMLEAFARENLPKGKKTFTLPTVSVAFRSYQGGVRVIKDKEAQGRALAYCKENFPHAIKTVEELKVSLLTNEDEAKIAERLMAAEEYPNLGDIGFEPYADYETVTIKTGVQ